MIHSNTCQQKAFSSIIVMTVAFIACICTIPTFEQNLPPGGREPQLLLDTPGIVTPSTTPYLTEPLLTPTSGPTSTTFYFYIYYTDYSNHQPLYVRLYIDGTMHSMSKLNPGDNTYSDSCDYYHTATLSAGSHSYYFTASDINGYTRTTSTYSGPTVTGNSISLSTASVSPTSGTTAQTYTYQVTYTNSLNHSPTYVRVYIDGISHTMSNSYGDYTFTDGAVYSYTTTLSARAHTYYFKAAEGSYTRTTSTYSGPTVVAVITLTSAAVSPSSGTTATTFTYSVTYTNINNLAPSYMQVRVDDTFYNMWKQNAGDNTYTDGCVYVYSGTFSSGSYEYYFYSSEGSSSASTTTYDLKIDEDPTGGIVAVVVVIAFLVVLGISVSAYKKKHPSPIAPRYTRIARPSPAMEPLSFQPVTQAPTRYEEPVIQRKSEMRPLPSPRTKPLSGKALVDKTSTILKGRNLSSTKFDEVEYQAQLQAFAASFVASWMTPDEMAVPLPVVAGTEDDSNSRSQENYVKASNEGVLEGSDVIHGNAVKGIDDGLASELVFEPVVLATPAPPPVDNSHAQEHIDQPVDETITHEPPAEMANKSKEDVPLAVSDIESQLMRDIVPPNDAGQLFDVPSSGETETEPLFEPESSAKPAEATGSPDTSAATPTAEVPKENSDLAKDGGADRQLVVDGPAESKDDPTVGSTESHRKAIDEIDAQLMSLIKHIKGSTEGSSRTDTGSPPDGHPSSESDSGNDTTPQALGGDSRGSKEAENPSE